MPTTVFQFRPLCFSIESSFLPASLPLATLHATQTPILSGNTHCATDLTSFIYGPNHISQTHAQPCAGKGESHVAIDIDIGWRICLGLEDVRVLHSQATPLIKLSKYLLPCMMLSG